MDRSHTMEDPAIVANDISGYDYGSSKVVKSPITVKELEQLKESAGFTTEDEHWLQVAGEVLKDQDLINSDVKSDHQDQQSPDDRRSSHPSLFPRNESDDLRLRWHNIQGRFVDEPRHAVEEADQLVGFVIGRLAEIFADERYGLEQQWSKAKAASTEDLRKSLRQYRSFFDRLLSL